MGHVASRAGAVSVSPSPRDDPNQTDPDADWDLDEPTQSTFLPDRRPEEGIVIEPEESTPLVMARKGVHPRDVARRSARVAFDALAQAPGYLGCLLIDGTTGGLLRADGSANSDPEFVAAEAAMWTAAHVAMGSEPIEEVVAVTTTEIHVTRSAEPSGRLFFVAICSKDNANLALVRLALQQATRWETTDEESRHGQSG